jgi:hypothetical protein
MKRRIARALVQLARRVDPSVTPARRIEVTLSGDPDELITAVTMAVNGEIGGRVGLGFNSPGYAGSIARY